MFELEAHYYQSNILPIELSRVLTVNKEILPDSFFFTPMY